ncbi:2-hydroxycarboxylate transporter family protein [Spiroplasma clarkii]|uniref:2-hydroxycarboxylate transporter family protein n=1 Tax=Spiroplasma clarkii TaxID=2139 RepID=UPI0011BA98C9|nr:2-hydroxycarboxylate transporter family protein [Spiroplasma clarkii]
MSQFKIWTIPLWMYLSFVGILVATILTGIVEANMIYGPAILLTIAIISGVIFSKIPIWKKYFGGAVMGSMFVGAFLVYFGVISNPGKLAGVEWNVGHHVYASVEAWFKNQDFLSLYISVLLVGAVLLIPRKMIIKATGGFFVLILAGTLLGVALGLVGSLMTGMSVKNLILYYALPILCDGNGGGIQPIGKIAEKFGYDNELWVTRALAISTLASIMSVIAAAVINGVGKAKPSLSGNGKLMLHDIHTVDRSAKANDHTIASALLMILMIYMLSDLFEKAIFTEERIKILVPNFAWMIIICLLLNLFNVIPTDMKLSAEKLTNLFQNKQLDY